MLHMQVPAGPRFACCPPNRQLRKIAFGYVLATTIAGRGTLAKQELQALSAMLSRFLTPAKLLSIDQIAAQITSAPNLFVLGRDGHVDTALIVALNLKEAT